MIKLRRINYRNRDDDKMDIYYIDRKRGEKKKEIVAGDKFLRWIYGTNLGNSILELLVKRKFFSSFYGKLQDVSFSRKKIERFVHDLSIDMKEAQREDIGDYKNFNEFFARKLKKEARPICEDPNTLISPADGRILAYENIHMDQVIQVKGSTYRLEEIFCDKRQASFYHGGVCIVIRLCPSDYHRFHFPDGGVPSPYRRIKGQYYSVNPMALNKIVGVYCQNKREITTFQSDHFGDMAMIEVGATCVGSIMQTYKEGKHVNKGEEKGYFKFGGSTVILFLEKEKIKMDEDLLYNTRNGMETKVNMGEGIGKKWSSQ